MSVDEVDQERSTEADGALKTDFTTLLWVFRRRCTHGFCTRLARGPARLLAKALAGNCMPTRSRQPSRAFLLAKLALV
jgi:hypothetical protein